MAAITDSETHLESEETVEAFEVTIVNDLPQSPIECVLSSPTASSTAPILEIAPVPTEDHTEDDSPPSTATFSTLAGKDRGKKTRSSQSRVNTRRSLNTRRSFTTAFKLECVEHAERTMNKTGTARKFNVDRRRVQEWCTQKEKLLAIPKQQKRLCGGKQEDSVDEPEDMVASGELTNTNAPTLLSGGLQGSETPLIHGIDVLTSDTIMESVVRGLSVAEVLPGTMIRLVQDISADLVSQGNNASMESMLRETSTVGSEMLIQRGVAGVCSSQGNGTGDSNTTVLAPELRGGVEISDQLIPEEDVSKLDTIPVSVDVEVMGMGEPQQQQMARVAVEEGSLASTPLTEPPFSAMDVTVQTAILDALMQVATTMQVTASDMLQSLSPTSVNQQPAVHSTSPRDVIVTPKEATQMAVELMSEETRENQALSNVSPSPIAVPKTRKSLRKEEAPLPRRSPVISSATQSMAALCTKVKKYYTVDFKLECVAYAESNSKCAAARHFNVDRRRVQDWCTQKSKLLDIQSMSLVERMPDETGIEKELAAVVKGKLDSGKSLTRRMVRDEAVRLFREHGNTAYTPSVGWVAKFMIRNNISLVCLQPLFSAAAEGSQDAGSVM